MAGGLDPRGSADRRATPTDGSNGTERDRLRRALGFDEASEDGFRQRAVQKDSVESQHDTIVVALSDLERKVDDLLSNVSSIDALTRQVRQLSEDVIHLERKLIGLR